MKYSGMKITSKQNIFKAICIPILLYSTDSINLNNMDTKCLISTQRCPSFYLIQSTASKYSNTIHRKLYPPLNVYVILIHQFGKCTYNNYLPISYSIRHHD